MAWKRSPVRTRPGPPYFRQLADAPLFGLMSFGVKRLRLLPNCEAVGPSFIAFAFRFRTGVDFFLNSALMESTVACTLFGISCIYTSIVVAARECRSTPCTPFTVPFLWASVAIVRRMNWKVKFGGSSSSASLVQHTLAIVAGVHQVAVSVREDERFWGWIWTLLSPAPEVHPMFHRASRACITVAATAALNPRSNLRLAGSTGVFH